MRKEFSHASFYNRFVERLAQVGLHLPHYILTA